MHKWVRNGLKVSITVLTASQGKVHGLRKVSDILGNVSDGLGDVHVSSSEGVRWSLAWEVLDCLGKGSNGLGICLFHPTKVSDGLGRCLFHPVSSNFIIVYLHLS